MDEKLCMPQREKFWSEKSDAEKIETLRSEVKTLGRALSEMHEIVEKLRSHGHDVHGRIVAPISDGRNYPTESKVPWRYQFGDDQRPF